MTTRTNARYLLVTDISRFYHSIYTHSLPWALHTKATAKANRNAPILGNLLDRALREAQDGQTNGIPIGPDTSFIMAEVLLSAVDQEFARRSPGAHGLRYIDDYNLSFTNRSEAEAALHALQASLAHFSLALNPAKTRIVDLPTPIQPSWVVFLRSQRFSNNPGAQETDLISHFSRAFDLRAEHPDVHVLHYAIGCVRPLTIHRTNWTILESLLLQCATAEPGALRLVLDEFLKAQSAGHPLNNAAMADGLNLIAEQHAPLGHGNEVAWALWGMIAFRLPVTAKAARAISEMDDDVVAVLALDADRRGLVPSRLNLQGWGASMTQQDLLSDHWLLSYEANVQGWLPSVGPVDHVTADQTFGFLKARGVRFYDLAAPLTSPTVPPWPRTGIAYY